MEEEKQNTEETAERLKRFHEQTKRQPKEPIQSDIILAFCAVIIIIVGVIASFFAFKGVDCAIYAFL